VLTGRTVTWATTSSSVATVNGSGLVTAQGAGTATITASSEGKTGSASVSVTGGSGGGTVLITEGFEDGSFAARGWYDNPGLTTTTAQAKTGNRSLEVHFTAGATNPTYGSAARHLFTATGTVYLSYWVKYSTNWVGSGKTYHPHEFLFVTTEDDQYVGPAYTYLTTYVEDNYQNGGVPVLAMTDGKNIDVSRIGQDLTGVTENRAAAGCNGNTDGYATGCYAVGGGLYNNEKIWRAAQPAFLPNPGPGYKNDWHLVEAYFQLNTIVNGVGQTDGVARYWVDGQLVIDHSNVLFRTGVHGAMKFNQLLVAHYIGDGSPVDQTMWIDDLTVATAKP
jgi:hypothetical protein